MKFGKRNPFSCNCQQWSLGRGSMASWFGSCVDPATLREKLLRVVLPVPQRSPAVVVPFLFHSGHHLCPVSHNPVSHFPSAQPSHSTNTPLESSLSRGLMLNHLLHDRTSVGPCPAQPGCPLNPGACRCISSHGYVLLHSGTFLCSPSPLPCYPSRGREGQ